MLREYQREMLSRLEKAWEKNRSVMVQMPTGTGKTWLMAETIRNAQLGLCSLANEGTQGSGVIVVAHRRELIEQISKTLTEFGIEHGVIVSGKEIDETKRVQVASVQTLARRGVGQSEAAHRGQSPCNPADGSAYSQMGQSPCAQAYSQMGQSPCAQAYSQTGQSPSAWSPCGWASPLAWEPGMVIVDEAHHALAKTYRMMWEWWPKAKFLGLTATPCRLNNAPFTDLFQTLLQSWPIQEFIDKGWLSDFEYVSASPDSVEMKRIASLEKRGADGDYQTKEMATVMDVPESIEHLYKTYRQFANGKKGIVYAIDRRHAEHIAAYYNDMGVRCAVIDSKTPVKESERLVEEYKMADGRCQMADGRCKPSDFSPQTSIDVLVNVDIFSEGFDAPEVEFIQLARPTLSLSKYLQQVGRGMRISEGKDHVLILDMVGLYQTFGLPTDERNWEAFFFGRAAGKGQARQATPIIIYDDDSEKRELVNLEMVRIRNRSTKLKGLAVYMLEGLYGVMKDGKQTTPAVFEQVERCDNGLFYAYGIYPYRTYQNRKTVIDMNGIDLGVQLYGTLSLQGEFLHGKNIKGDVAIWDIIGRRYYQDREPNFEHVGWLDLIKVNGSEYELRYNRGLQLFRFRKSEILINQQIAIIRDILIVRSANFRAFKIFGYNGDQVLACGKKQYSTISVSWDGHVGGYQEMVPKDFTIYPEYEKLRLKGG